MLLNQLSIELPLLLLLLFGDAEEMIRMMMGVNEIERKPFACYAVMWQKRQEQQHQHQQVSGLRDLSGSNHLLFSRLLLCCPCTLSFGLYVCVFLATGGGGCGVVCTRPDCCFHQMR